MDVLLGNSLAIPIKNAFSTHSALHDDFKILASSFGKFASGEAFGEILPEGKDLNGKPVIIVQSLGATQDHTANDYAMELLFAVDNLRQNGTGPIWVIAPFLAYARQDRAFGGRMTSVAIDTFCMCLKACGVVGLSTIEIHSQGALTIAKKHFGDEGVFNLDVTALYAKTILESGIASQSATGGPDKGAHDRARRLGEMLGSTRFSIEKQHVSANETEVTNFTGDVAGKASITVDDMIDTGGTIANAQVELAARGASPRIVAAAHGVFSGTAVEKLFTKKTDDKKPAIDQIIVTDSIDPSEKLSALRRQYGAAVDERFTVASVGPLLVEHALRDIANHPAMRIA